MANGTQEVVPTIATPIGTPWDKREEKKSVGKWIRRSLGLIAVLTVVAGTASYNWPEIRREARRGRDKLNGFLLPDIKIVREAVPHIRQFNESLRGWNPSAVLTEAQELWQETQDKIKQVPGIVAAEVERQINTLQLEERFAAVERRINDASSRDRDDKSNLRHEIELLRAQVQELDKKLEISLENGASRSVAAPAPPPESRPVPPHTAETPATSPPTELSKPALQPNDTQKAGVLVIAARTSQGAAKAKIAFDVYFDNQNQPRVFKDGMKPTTESDGKTVPLVVPLGIKCVQAQPVDALKLVFEGRMKNPPTGAFRVCLQEEGDSHRTPLNETFEFTID
jgi:hypothetical protein